MSGLHPRARMLVNTALRNEPEPSADTVERVRRTVLRRAFAAGATVAATSAAGAAKAGVLGTGLAGLATHLISIGVVGGIFGAAVVIAHPILIETSARRPSASVVVAAAAEPRRAISAAEDESPADKSGTSDSEGFAAGPPAPSIGEAVPLATQEPSVTGLSAVPSNEIREIRAARPSSPARASQPPAGRAPTSSGDGPVVATPAAVGSATNPYGQDDAARVDTGARMPMPTGATKPIATDLSAELEILHRAHSALRQNRPQEAFELLRRQESAFHGGALEEQAQALLISSLCQLGRETEARALLDRFVTRWPDTPLSDRLYEHGCGAAQDRNTPR